MNRHFTLPLISLLSTFLLVQALAAQISQPPVINSFTPDSGRSGTSVIIRGTHLGGATAVSFGKTPAYSYTVMDPTTVTAIVGAGASGRISVTTPDGSDSISGFTYIPGTPTSAPIVSYFLPSSGGPGTVVIIKGVNLGSVTAVSFGGTPATYMRVDDSATLAVVVGNGSVGQVVLTGPYGSDTVSGFTFVAGPPPAFPAPLISSFTPDSAGPGTPVTIRGSNLNGATAVNFGGTPAYSYAVVDSSTITAIVGAGATGSVWVTTPGGTDTLRGFTFIPELGPPPVDSFFSLITFSGAVDSAGVVLQWQTVNDKSMSSYIIERAPDSVTFTAIGVQDAVGGSFNHYTYVDASAPAGKNYYQIRMVDTVGGSTYSLIVPVTLPGIKGALLVYPNPAVGSVTVNYPTPASPGQLTIYNLSGKLVKSAALSPGTTRITLDVMSLTHGLYMLVLKQGGKTLNYRLMVN